MIEFEVLAGMPVYGPYPEQFTSTSWGTHSEGFVVRIVPSGLEPWVGNFQRGLSSFDGVHPHPNERDLIVVAGGQAYVVESTSRHLVETFGADLSWSRAFPEHQLVLFHNGIWFTAYGPSGKLWKSRRVSWDGIRVQSVEFPSLSGDAWSPLEDRWVVFTLDMERGGVSGGSYDGPD
jgi:hypothetical protein